jgi:hypothetical protein
MVQRRMEISWTKHVRNEEMLQTVKKERNIIQTIKRNTYGVGHISYRNCLLLHIIDGNIQQRKGGKTRKKT